DVECKVCGRESCEDHLPPDPDPPSTDGSSGRPIADQDDRLVEVEYRRERAKRDARRRLDREARPPVVLPEFLTLRERLARPRPDTDWRIEGWQPQHSRVLIAAQFKSGKTTFLGSLMRSLIDGDPFLD